MKLKITTYKRGWKWFAHLENIDGQTFLITPVYRAYSKDRAIAKATKAGKRIGADWATKNTQTVEV